MKKLCFGVALLVVTVIFGTMFIAFQQYSRTGANTTPRQLADDAADQLDGGAQPSDTYSRTVDMDDSLLPFIIIYDKNGNPIGGSGTLDGQVPRIGKDVLAHATPNHDSFVTWEPKPGVRIASVEVAAQHYYVLGGQSLQTVDERINLLFKIVVAGWLMSVTIMVAAYFIVERHVRTTS